MTVNLMQPPSVRGSTLTDEQIAQLNELVAFYGIVSVARKADTSVQSVAKGMSKLRLLESTKRKIGRILR